jgi:4-hydroxybenzoate polyprenyltransferase
MREWFISGGGCIWNDILDKDFDRKVGTCGKEEHRLVD